MKKPWMEDWGFAFDPFEHLEASQDVHLHRYLVGHRDWSAVLAEQPHVVFSPPGGGKTALRLYLYRTCWTGGQGQRPFALHYSLPDCWEFHTLASLAQLSEEELYQQHLSQMVRMGARSLFFGSCYFPVLFLHHCPPAQRAALAQFIDHVAPETRWYLEVIRETKNPNTAAVHAGNAFVLNHQPDFALLEAFLREWEKALKGEKSTAPFSSSLEAFEQELFLIREVLGFPGIFILMDGVDGMTAYQRLDARKVLKPLLRRIPEWGEQDIFLKAFLPEEVHEVLEEDLREVLNQFPPLFIRWQVSDLIELLQARIRVATGGAFDSFASVAAPPLCYEEVERILVSMLPEHRLLPREALTLVSELLNAYTQRMEHFHPLKRLEQEDVEWAGRRYRQQYEIFANRTEIQSWR
ncbi:hypothetical protein [Anaerolinea thermophila]|uniref:Uncharacterized protein n=1 Tax=Anaerolinea thermophila (strain DSM 14523 / JCM 11388 / NBRC 100420 / UNI-1) TaxID=926569 RepID=E8N275_ANATU|nr:hypothetical protein [Anaerolinea thermophila]BAJ65022.1 hypothetical protein ANT_29960 [Anaerolinea thermophila UNI-1]